MARFLKLAVGALAAVAFAFMVNGSLLEFFAFFAGWSATSYMTGDKP